MRVISRFPSMASATLIGFAHVVGALADDAPFARSVRFDAKLDEAGRLDTWNSEEIKILAQPAVQQFGQIVLPVNEYFDTLEIAEAETIKADGARVAVPSDKILISALPNASSMSMLLISTEN